MIKFPNLSNYISDFENKTNIVAIKIYDILDKNRAKYFNVHIPCLYRGIFVEILQNIIKDKFSNLRIEQVKTSVIYEDITIWQLAWFINNITEHKRVLISVEDPNDEHYSLQTSVYLNDEKDFNRLKEQINHFYDKDFDGLVD